jgi:two-component system sensor histidine kinase/response regulator
MLQSNPECFDAVLMQLNLPIIDGIECAKLIRQDDRLNNVALIALLDDQEMLREDLAELGFQGLLKKPIQRALLDQELMAAVQASSVLLCNLNLGPLDMQAPYRASAATSTPTVSSPPAGLKCLIVEDNIVCMKVTKKMMQKLGFHVECADNGLKGFEMLKEDSARADLVLMDLRMPVMDGLQATRKIRQELGLKTLPIIALTAEIVNESWAADFNGVITKPAEVARIRTVCFLYVLMGGRACVKCASSQPHVSIRA